MNKTEAVIYIRVSDPQQIEGTSLEFQEAQCRDYCNRNQLTVAAVFRDEGESAKDLRLNNREEFFRALEFCRKNRQGVGHFVVLAVSRFARNTEDHFAVRKVLSDYAVRLHSVTETIGDSPTEKFIETVLAGAAEYDNAIRKRRCIDGMTSRIRQGICPWRPPVGYVCGGFKKRGEKKTRPDEPHPSAFVIIRRGLKEYAKGKCSQRELAKRLDEWGLAEVRGRTTTTQMVDRLLGKYLKFYAGVLTDPWTGEEYPGRHEAMISEQELRRVMLVRSGKAFTVRKDRLNPLFPLRRTVKCATCTRRLTGSVSRGRGGKYAYYHCATRSCDQYGKTVPKAKLETEFVAFLRSITPDTGFLTAFEESLVDLWCEIGDRFADQQKAHSRQRAELLKRKQRIFEMREDGSYSREDFLERKARLDEQIAVIERSFQSTPSDGLDVPTLVEFAVQLISSMSDCWLQLQPETRARFQMLVLPDGITHHRESGFGTPRLGLLFRLNQESHGRKSQLVDHLRISWNSILKELSEYNKLRDLKLATHPL